MTEDKKRLLTGLKPTASELHIGNYLGAIRPLVQRQNEYETFVFLADFHALTGARDADVLRRNIENVALDYLACGIDPSKVYLYKQSDVPAHAELAWIFDCLTGMGYLERAHAYKDAMGKGAEVNVGTFTYPMLMAADILLYDADLVPVGRDQKQHIEFARDTAEKFNHHYGQTFNSPDGLIDDAVATVPGIDGRKMSKSYGNTISLFASDDEIAKAVMSIPTDSKRPDEPKEPQENTLFHMHRSILDSEGAKDLELEYSRGGTGYKELKERLISDIQAFIAPLREKRHELEEERLRVKDILRGGLEKVAPMAEAKMKEIRKKIGVTL